MASQANMEDYHEETAGPPALGPSTLKKSKTTTREPYTIKQFEVHAVLIDRLWNHKTEEDLEALVASHITSEDAAKAAGVVTILPPKRLEELKAEARQYAPGAAKFNNLTQCLQPWVEAFRSGPDCRTTSNYTADPNPKPAPLPTPMPEPLSHRFHRRLNIAPLHRGRQEHYRPFPNAPEEEDLIEDNFSQGPGTSNPPDFKPRFRELSRDSFKEPERYKRHRRLKAEEVMIFDPKEKDVRFFIRRIKVVAAQEGEQPVLNILPFCLKGRALDWHTQLPESTHEELSNSLRLWYELLETEFKKDPIEARREARQLRFTFTNSSTLSLADYLFCKVNLLRTAGTTDLESTKSEIWEGLDPKLALIVQIYPGEPLERFRQRIRDAEPGARRDWEANIRFQRDNTRSPLSKDRIQRLRTRINQVEDRNIAPVPTSTSPTPTNTPGRKAPQPVQQVRAKREPLRPCRHCGGQHWDFDCPTRKINTVTAEARTTDGEDHNILDEQDLETIQALEDLSEPEN